MNEEHNSIETPTSKKNAADTRMRLKVIPDDDTYKIEIKIIFIFCFLFKICKETTISSGMIAPTHNKKQPSASFVHQPSSDSSGYNL